MKKMMIGLQVAVPFLAPIRSTAILRPFSKLKPNLKFKMKFKIPFKLKLCTVNECIYVIHFV